MTAPPLSPNAKPGTWETHDYQGMAYNVLLPDGYSASYRYPVCLLLHQYEDEGEQPQQFDPWVNTAAFRARHPAIFVLPHCNINGQTSTADFNWGGVTPALQTPMVYALAILSAVMLNHSVDPARVFVVGNSMGGLGVWGILCNPDQRKLFAAAMPIDGSCYYQVGNEPAIAQSLKDFPLWSNHGTQDTQVSPAFDQAMAKAFAAIGSTKQTFTSPAVGHGSWGDFYPRQDVWDWLFAQSAAGADPAQVRATALAALADAATAIGATRQALMSISSSIGKL